MEIIRIEKYNKQQFELEKEVNHIIQTNYYLQFSLMTQLILYTFWPLQNPAVSKKPVTVVVPTTVVHIGALYVYHERPGIYYCLS